MRKFLFVAVLTLLFTGVAAPSAEAYGHGKHKHRKGRHYKRGKSPYAYYNSNYYGPRSPRVIRKHKVHPVHGPGWVPPGQRKKMTPRYDRW